MKRKGPGFLWTPEEIERMRIMAIEGRSQREVASALVRSKGSVCRVAKREGILFQVREGGGPHAGKRFAVWTEAEEKKLWLWAGYKTVPRIARLLGRSAMAVYLKCQHLGIAMSPEETARSIAAHLAVAPATVLKHRDRLGQRWRKMNGRWGFKYVRGPTPEEVQAIAQSILDEPHLGDLKTSLRRLKRIADGFLPEEIT